MRFFSYDGIISRIIRFVLGLFLLNFAYLLCCIPVVTAGAANTALYAVFLNQQEDERMVRCFFHSFRKEFAQSTKIWAVFLLLLLLLAGDYYCLFAYDFPGEGIAWILSVIVSVIFLSVSAFVFPLQAHYQNPVEKTIRNAVILGVGLILVGVLLNIVTFLPVILYFVSTKVFYNVVIWRLPAWSALAALVNGKILGAVFRKLQPEGKAS